MIQRWTVVLGWIARLTMIFCSLINTRLLIGILEVEGFASFAILMSLAPWLALVNMGLPNAVQNLIARSRAEGNPLDAMQNSAISLALLLGLGLIPVAVLMSIGIQQALLKNHEGMQIMAVVIIVWSMICSGLALVFSQILYAHHRANIPAAAPALQAALTTIALLGVAQCEGERSILVASALALPVIILFSSLAICASRTGVFRFELSQCGMLIKAGQSFMFFTVISTFSVACDYIVMARLLSSVEVAQYSLVSKCFSVVLSLHAVVLSASWTPMSDLFYKKSFDHMRPMVLRVLGVGFCLLILACIPIAFGLDSIIGFLSGNIVPGVGFAAAAGAISYLAVRVWTDTFAMVLMSCNQMSTMNAYIVWQSVLAISLQWLLGNWYGVPGIFVGATLSFLITASWILPYRVRAVVRGQLV
ncbi:MATE family efflux transporter [Roseateles sp. GG27B]